MSSSLLHLVCKRRHGVVNLLPCLSPMWKLRPCHSSTKLPHLCHCLIQLCQNNIICSPSPSLAIAHMFTNTEVQMLLSLNKQKITFAQTGFQQVSARGVLVFADGRACGLLRKNKSWRDKGSVWALWSAGGLWEVLATMSWLCIVGAFTKFAIFENRIFFKTRRSQVKKKSTDFVFFTVLIYTIE